MDGVERLELGLDWIGHRCMDWGVYMAFSFVGLGFGIWFGFSLPLCWTLWVNHRADSLSIGWVWVYGSLQFWLPKDVTTLAFRFAASSHLYPDTIIVSLSRPNTN